MGRVMKNLPARWAARDLLDHGGRAGVRAVSLHDQVINLQVDEWNHMLMLAAPGMYRGPASAGLGDPDFRALREELKPGDTGWFEDGRIDFPGGGFTVSLADAELVSFSVPRELEIRGASIAAAEGELAASAASQLCSCLLGEPGMDPFGEAIRLRFPLLLRSLVLGSQAEFETACSSLIGLGYGSTPTGDDLIHGALIALHCLNQILLRPIPRLPRGLGRRTTLLGAHMLEMGRLGLTPEPVLAFALDLLAGKPISGSLDGVRRMGADSGISIAVGFYLMVQEHLKASNNSPFGGR